MGGSKSEEFLAICENGEDTFVRCQGCGYAANVEAVSTLAPAASKVSDENPAHTEQTPKTPTIDSLVNLSNNRDDLKRDDREWHAADTLKNVVFKVTRPDGSKYVLAIGLPGNRDVDIKRLETFIHPDEPEVFEEEDFKAHPLLKKGYIGPAILGEKSETKIRYLVDPRIVDGTRWISGANEYNHHTYDLMMGRDFKADGIVEAAEVLPGDDCPTGCGGNLETARGIEIGHIFQLGRKYAEALDLKVQDENGENRVVTMGSYGIGVSRLVAAIAEQHHDEKGLTWPKVAAPADVHIVATGKEDAVFEAAEKLANEFTSRGVEVLYDDRRSASAGVKFNDAELLGIPVTIVVGKLLVDGKVELKVRKTGERSEVEISDAVDAAINV
jgi:prolyl-tRNA synthetase